VVLQSRCRRLQDGNQPSESFDACTYAGIFQAPRGSLQPRVIPQTLTSRCIHEETLLTASEDVPEYLRMLQRPPEFLMLHNYTNSIRLWTGKPSQNETILTILSVYRTPSCPNLVMS
jgi:hypothetical protein